MPRMFQNSMSAKTSLLCLENQNTPIKNFPTSTADLKDFGVSVKENGIKLLSVLLKKSSRTVRILKKRTRRALRLLQEEIAEAQTKKKALSPVGRLIAELPVLSFTLSAGIVMFLFFAALAAAERGVWGMVGGEIFAVAAGIGLFYRIIRKLS